MSKITSPDTTMHPFKFLIDMEYRFLQYPRGLNKGGYSIPMYARLSVAHRGKTIVSWLRYVQANKRCLDEHSTYSWGGDVQGSIRQSWILRHSIQHHYKSWQFTSLRNSRRMDKVKNNRGGELSKYGVRSKLTEVLTERVSVQRLALPTFRSQE